MYPRDVNSRNEVSRKGTPECGWVYRTDVFLKMVVFLFKISLYSTYSSPRDRMSYPPPSTQVIKLRLVVMCYICI